MFPHRAVLALFSFSLCNRKCSKGKFTWGLWLSLELPRVGTFFYFIDCWGFSKVFQVVVFSNTSSAHYNKTHGSIKHFQDCCSVDFLCCWCIYTDSFVPELSVAVCNSSCIESQFTWKSWVSDVNVLDDLCALSGDEVRNPSLFAGRWIQLSIGKNKFKTGSSLCMLGLGVCGWARGHLHHIIPTLCLLGEGCKAMLSAFRLEYVLTCMYRYA